MTPNAAAVEGVERYYVRGIDWRMSVGLVTQVCDCRDPCVEVVRASDFDSLAAENVRLREALTAIVEAWPAHGSAVKNATADAMAAKARAALAGSP